ncbi:MAG: hypothetical protein H6R07_3416 [Proteobacteria bacterium]|nr:hypothetical protein [Pseudomonadota bacterium]
MLLNLATLIVTALGWGGLLWFRLPINLANFSPLSLIALHVGPPLLVTLWVWLWQRARNKRVAMVEAERAAAEAEKNAAVRTAAQAVYDERMAQRRFACDCRAVAVAGLVAQNEGVADLLPEGEGIYWGLVDAEEMVDFSDPLEALTPYLEEALTELYQHSPAAIWLPHFISPPHDVAGEMLLAKVREAACTAAAQVVDEEVPSVLVRFLPEAGHTTERFLGLFESDQALPGAVVLGFDSPLVRRGPVDEDAFPGDEEPAEREVRYWQGLPGQAVAALLLTAPWLERQAADLRVDVIETADADAYTPYWERNHASDNDAWLARIPAIWRASLVDAPILACLHRGGSRQAGQEVVRPLALANFCLAALDRALVNAGLRDMPFGAESPAEPKAPLNESCCWLVHHAGAVECGGTRLAALGNALTYFGIDLHPVDEASNSVVQFGHVGRALPLLLSALTVAHAARDGGAVCAEFPSPSEVATWLALAPAQT